MTPETEESFGAFKKLATFYLNMAIYEPIQFNVIVVFAEWINQNFSDFQPTDVETELANKYRVSHWLKMR